LSFKSNYLIKLSLSKALIHRVTGSYGPAVEYLAHDWNARWNWCQSHPRSIIAGVWLTNLTSLLLQMIDKPIVSWEVKKVEKPQ